MKANLPTYEVSFNDMTKATVTAADKFEAWNKAVSDGKHTTEDVVSVVYVDTNERN